MEGQAVEPVARPAGEIVCFATQGSDHTDAERLRVLLAPLGPRFFDFDRAHKRRSALRLFRDAARRRPRLVVMEGTGIAGGLTLIALNLVLGIPYVVSSGDAVGPYLRLRSRPAAYVGGLYERALYRRCAAFVGWTPYLAGRGLSFGAPRAATAPGWADGEAAPGAREAVRARHGIAPDALVFGIVGTLNWRDQTHYAYGAELVSALRRTTREDLVVCIVGDGSGRARLETLAGEDLGGRAVFTGRVAPSEVPNHLAAFDVASLPQTVDSVGSFRYTTKLSEYLAARLLVLTGRTPAAYDLDGGWAWRVPGDSPVSEPFVEAVAKLMSELQRDELDARRAAVTDWGTATFDRDAQQRRVCALVTDLLADREG